MGDVSRHSGQKNSSEHPSGTETHTIPSRGSKSANGHNGCEKDDKNGIEGDCDIRVVSKGARANGVEGPTGGLSSGGICGDGGVNIRSGQGAGAAYANETNGNGEVIDAEMFGNYELLPEFQLE